MFVVAANAPATKSPVPLRRPAVAGPVSQPRYLLDPAAMAATIVGAGPDEEIIAQGDPAEYCYQVIEGCVRTVTLLGDGRRQIGQFLLPGDIFGWEGAGEHPFAAEAVTHVRLCRFRLSVLDDRAATDRVFAQRLRTYIVAQVQAARDHLVLLGRKTAAERIASFLLRMRERLAADGSAMPVPGRRSATTLGGLTVIDLPMSRADMADYLGLTIETVCRGLTELRRQGTIAVERGRIVIHDGVALGRVGSDQVH
jgi:CRP/FNR family nitrogen fixation transcriptional regulator